MKKQNRMEKLVRKMLIVGVAIFLLGTLIPLVGGAVEIGEGENQGDTLLNIGEILSEHIDNTILTSGD